MNINRLLERGREYAAGPVSRLGIMVPPLGDYAVGSDPRLRRVIWHRTRMSATALDVWAKFPGDPLSGDLPKDFHSVAYSVVAREAMRERHPDVHEVVRPVIAWPLGRVVMVGEVNLRDLDTIDGDYVLPTRIGQDEHFVAGGQWAPYSGKVRILPDVTQPITSVVIEDLQLEAHFY